MIAKLKMKYPAPLSIATAALSLTLGSQLFVGSSVTGASELPARIAIMQDKTASTNSTRTQQMKLEDLNPLIELLKRSGGEICFGLIRDNSNRSLTRLRIEEQPEKPNKKNTIAAARERPKYNKVIAEHEESSAQRIESFKKEITPLLQQKANAMRSDIWGAVMRADLCLSEDDSSWRQKPLRYAVIVSDGIHDANTRFTPMKSEAKVIFVYGSPNPGPLERLKPMRFESAEAAFRFIAAPKQGGK